MTNSERFEVMSKDEGLIKLTRRASKRFNTLLRPEEIENCILLALWKSIINFDETQSMKFTTYLYRGVIMECQTQYKINSGGYGGHKPRALGGDHHVDHRDDFLKVDLMDEIERDRYRDILIKRFIDNYSSKEIAQTYGISYQNINQKIAKSCKKRRGLTS